MANLRKSASGYIKVTEKGIKPYHHTRKKKKKMLITDGDTEIHTHTRALVCTTCVGMPVEARRASDPLEMEFRWV